MRLSQARDLDCGFGRLTRVFFLFLIKFLFVFFSNLCFFFLQFYPSKLGLLGIELS